jgi:hypothetical protein
MRGLKPSHQQDAEKFGAEAGSSHITHDFSKD